MNNAEFEKIAKQLAVSAVTRDTTELGHIKRAAGFDLNSIGQYINTPAGRYALGGLGGAGIGALVGAMQPKRKGRNALYYGALGGLGGLGLAHLYNSAGGKPAPAEKKEDAAVPPPVAPTTAAITPETAATAPKPPVLPAVQPPAKDAPPSAQNDYSARQEWIKNNPWAHPALFQGGKPNIPRHPLASKLRHDGGLTPFQNWVQTGKSTDAWYDLSNIAGDTDDQNNSQFEKILRDYYEKTKTPAESLQDLIEVGYLPEGIDAPFKGVLASGANIATSPQYLADVNAMRQMVVPESQPLYQQTQALNKGPLSFARAAQLLGLSPEDAFRQYQAAANAGRKAKIDAWTGAGF